MSITDRVGVLRSVSNRLHDARTPDDLAVPHPRGTARYNTSTSTAKQWFYPRCDDGEMHEPPVSRALLDRLTPDTTFFDVGSNVGYYTQLAASAGAAVHSFDVDPVLTSIVASHPRDDCPPVEVVTAAVGEATGELVSFSPHQPHNPSTNQVDPEATGTGATVTTLALDDYCAQQQVRPDVLKVDVEGFEAQALAGAFNTLASVDTILLELHPEQLAEYGEDASDVVASVRDLGFDVRRFVDHRGETGFVSVAPDREWRENCVLLCERS